MAGLAIIIIAYATAIVGLVGAVIVLADEQKRAPRRWNGRW